MLELFSPTQRAYLFRLLWLCLAKAEKEVGISISQQQIEEMEKTLWSIDFATIDTYEKRLHHDVMAHIHAWGDICPLAKPILHLGATSTFVTDNADLLQMRQALELLSSKLQKVCHYLATLAKKHAADPCLGYTHFQKAQPTTIGKRIALWLQDFLFDLDALEKAAQELPLLGIKGATGTQSSFLTLVQEDPKKVEKMEKTLAKELGVSTILPLASQTYTRKIDLRISQILSSFAASAHKMGTDLRLLAHEGEILERFDKEQVGSSAMPYKKNPILAERICGLSRFVLSLGENPAYTLATQWLERSLDDSSNKRLTIPQLFFGVDAILELLLSLALYVDAPLAQKNVEASLPLLASEQILLQGTLLGHDRQELHETLRQITLEAQKKKDPQKAFLQEIQKRGLSHLLPKNLSAASLTGLAKEQTLQFLRNQMGKKRFA